MFLDSTQERCRICLKITESHISLLKKVPIGEDNILISEILKYCGNIKVLHNDRKPENACSTCIENVKVAYGFKLMCMQSETTLNTEILTEIINRRNPLEFMKEDDVIDVKDEEISNIKDEPANLNNAEAGGEEREDSDDSFNDYDNAEQKKSSDCFESSDEQEESNNATENNDDNVENAGKTKKREHKCPHCDKSFKYRCHLLKHSSMHDAKDKKKCHYCDFKASGIQLGIHMREMHNDCKTIQCPNCDKRFFHRFHLKQHIMLCHTDAIKSQVCNVCGKAYVRVNDLRKHKMVHTGERPYPCSLCDKRFRSSNNLKTHMNTHSRQMTAKCELCSKEFAQKWGLLLHFRQHTGEKPYACEVCGKAFKQKQHLNVHKASNSHLQRHSRMHDVKIKRKHEIVHTEERPYPCSLCDKRFRNVYTRKAHMNTHTKQRTFKCDVCSKEFNWKSSLRIHLRIHTGEKPEICEVCGKAFRALQNLRSHRASQHPNT